MLKLKGLRFSGIGRFVEEQDIPLESLGNLVQVDGENRNTGGSSGSGKSTVFNALDFLLGLNDLSSTVLQSRLTKDPISVRGEFDFDGKPLLITRNKRGLIIDLDGETIEGSSKLSEERLDQIIGMPRELFRKILHKRQKEGGFFLEFTPKKMYEFLTDCLNLTEMRKKSELVENDVKNIENSKIVLENGVETAKSALKATQENILSLGLPPVRDVHQDTILMLKTRYDRTADTLARCTVDMKTQNDALEAERPALVPNPVLETAPTIESPTLLDTSLDNMSTITHLEGLNQALNKQMIDLNQAENDRIAKVRQAIQERKLAISMMSHRCTIAVTAKNEAGKLAGEIKQIRAAICPTCEQSWVTESAKIKETELLARLTQFKTQIQDGTLADTEILATKMDILDLEKQLEYQATEELFKVQAEMESIKAQIAEERKKALDYKTQMQMKNAELMAEHSLAQKMASMAVNAKNDAAMAEVSAKNKVIQEQFQLKATALRQIWAQELEQHRGQANVDKMALDAALNKLKVYQEIALRYNAALVSMKQQEVEYQAQIEEKMGLLVGVEQRLALAEEVRKAIKTFLSCSFDEALESIGDAATKIIRCIPTMSNATIQFEGQKETKEGKVKEEVNAVISMDGEVGIPIKSLSGGERSAVDLAVDLAVIDFIESETSKGIDVFILDEPFTGLDTVGIEMALEVLKNSNTNKRLIVVDHNPEVKQMVSNRIVVVREGLTSTITGQEVMNG